MIVTWTKTRHQSTHSPSILILYRHDYRATPTPTATSIAMQGLLHVTSPKLRETLVQFCRVKDKWSSRKLRHKHTSIHSLSMPTLHLQVPFQLQRQTSIAMQGLLHQSTVTKARVKHELLLQFCHESETKVIVSLTRTKTRRTSTHRCQYSIDISSRYKYRPETSAFTYIHVLNNALTVIN